MENPDTFIEHATEKAWEDKKIKDAIRAKDFELKHWMSYEEIEALSPEEYLRNRWYDENDKKGIHHWRNMVASAMQSAKSLTGSSFENSIMDLLEKNGIDAVGQVNIDEDGGIHTRKSVHRIDGYISATDCPTNIKECYVLSKKTTLRERWNQDIWCVPICKGLIFLTRETPNQSTISSIKDHKSVVVYPNAPITENTWSYTEFLRRMKLFQQGSTNSTS